MRYLLRQHYVYLIKNLTTGEYYIGKRSCYGEPSKDIYMGSGTLLKRKMEAHPDHEWIKTILFTCETEDQALLLEEELIADKWKTDDLCLNLTRGGRGSIPIKYKLRPVDMKLTPYRQKKDFNQVKIEDILNGEESDVWRLYLQSKDKRYWTYMNTIKGQAYPSYAKTLIKAGWTILNKRRKSWDGELTIEEALYLVFHS